MVSYRIPVIGRLCPLYHFRTPPLRETNLFLNRLLRVLEVFLGKRLKETNLLLAEYLWDMVRLPMNRVILVKQIL